MKYLYQISEASRLSLTSSCDEQKLKAKLLRWNKDKHLAGIRVWLLAEKNKRILILNAMSPGFYW